jgi:hypothetical protein
LPRKDAALIRQVHAGRIDQVDYRRAAPHGDLLSAEHLLDRLRPPRPGFDSGVIRHNHDLATGDQAEAGDDAGGRRLAVVFVICDEQADLLKPRARIEQARYAFARRQFALTVLAFDLVRAPALP